jgi:hypothetical protein
VPKAAVIKCDVDLTFMILMRNFFLVLSWELHLELGSCNDKVLTSDIKVEVLDGTRKQPGPANSGTRDDLQH